MEGPFTKKVLPRKLQCKWSGIAVGKMGLICEGETIDKWRLVFDATVSGVNPLVWLPEHCEVPGIQDLLGALSTSGRRV